MAADFIIPGPCSVYIGTGVDPSSNEAAILALDQLGFATDDDLFRVQFQYLNNAVQASDTGEETAESVYAGLTATVSGSLSKWDPNAATEFVQAPGSTVLASAGIGAGVIGTPLIATGAAATLSLAIVPLAAGETIYFFPRCYVEGEFTIFDMGNTNLKAGFSVNAFRVGAGSGDEDALATGSTATEIVYRKITKT